LKEYRKPDHQYEFKDSPLLTDDQVSDILSRAAQFETWLKAVKTDALKKAVAGKKWPGFKLVEGRSNRIYTDKALVEDKLIQAGFTEDIIFKPKELLGITALQGALGKKVFDSTLDGLIIKPLGKPALVTESDKRAEYNTAGMAERDFNDDFDESEE